MIARPHTRTDLNCRQECSAATVSSDESEATFDRSGLMTDVLLGRPQNIFRHQDRRLFTEEAFPNNLEATLCVECFCRHR